MEHRSLRFLNKFLKFRRAEYNTDYWIRQRNLQMSGVLTLGHGCEAWSGHGNLVGDALLFRVAVSLDELRM